LKFNVVDKLDGRSSDLKLKEGDTNFGWAD